MSTKRTPSAAAPTPPAFAPVPVRPRHDGWTPERQVDFIAALADSGCVDEACRRVGMSPSTAYALRRRIDAVSFRQAWDCALDVAIQRLSDAAFSRALHGVAVPVFYKGEQVGERRRFDERLTTFLLRYRDPARYGAFNDELHFERHPQGPAFCLSRATAWLECDAWDEALGHRPSPTRRKPAADAPDGDVS